MDLTKVTVAIRPRRPWEAVDLGIRMARRWWWPLLKVWLVLSLPVWALLHLLPSEYFWLPPLVIWWSKPLWERALLYILSQVVFGYLPSTRETLRAFPRLLGPQLLATLTWRRLSPHRSMDLPVSQLEGLTCRRRSERIALLRQEDAQPASWLTIIGIHLEGFLALAAAILAWALIPVNLDVSLTQDILDTSLPWLLVIQNLMGYLAAAVVAPFYVAAGFALYLNRRVQLEGWDIEIAFRQMLQKRQVAPTPAEEPPAAKQTVAGKGAAAIVGFATCTLFAALLATSAPPIMAEEATAHAPAAAKENIREVLAGENFNEMKQFRTPVLFKPDEDTPSDFKLSLPEWWPSLPWLAPLLEALFWGLIILLSVLVVFRYRHWLAEFSFDRKPRPLPPRPDTLFGLDMRPESLPKDVPATVQKLWSQGQQRAALALLYRACLIKLMDMGLVIGPGYTEEDCLQLAQHHTPDSIYHYLTRTTRLWQRLAYGHREPSLTDVEQLCSTWHATWSTGVANA